MGKKVILTLFLALFLFTIVSAVPPFQSSNPNQGLTLEYQKFDNLKSGSEFEVNLHVFNSSNGLLMTNQTTECIFHGYFANGSHAIETPMLFDEEGRNFELLIPSIFFTVGKGAVMMRCNSSTAGGFISVPIVVTTTGLELSTSQSIIYLISFSFLIFIFGLLMLGLAKIPRDIKDDGGFIINVSKLEAVRPVLMGLAWMVLTAITFIVSNVTIAYIQTGLMGKFIFLIFQLMMLSNLLILPLAIIKMIQRIMLSKEMLGLIERGVKI